MTYSASISGLNAAQTDLDVVANNLANSETAGFKRSSVNFADVVVASTTSDPNHVSGAGVRVASTRQDFSIGSIEQTGNALDLAVSGAGFFTTVSPVSGQTAYTRDGQFTQDASGFLTDSNGNQVQMIPPGASSPVAAKVDVLGPGGSTLAGITIAADGGITGTYVDGSTKTVGKVALASFASQSGLKPVGASDWMATALSGAPTYGTPGGAPIGTPGAPAFGALLAGSVERSNVDVSNDMVGLITAQRYFQANAKAIDTETQISQTIINLRT
jgi:flagellar hook protein FlgE